MVQAEIAVLRFGLGARPGELAEAAHDPRGWLKAQIAEAVPLAANASLASSDSIFMDVLAARAQRQELKRETPANPAPPANPVREAYLPHYRAQVLARAQSAALTTRPFAERLVYFWRQSLCGVRGQGRRLRSRGSARK